MNRVMIFGVLGLALMAGTLAAVAAEPLKHPESTAGWEDLFAPDLSNAFYPKGVWSFEKGELTATEDQAIWTKADYENFVIDLEFKNSPAANSGVFLYCSNMAKWVTSCFEVQILDDYAPKWADVAPNWRCGGVFGRLAPAKQVVKPAGEWNRYVITCQGPRLKVVFNGEQVIDLELDKSGLKNRPAEGYIGFQDEGKPVWYRNVRIKELP